MGYNHALDYLMLILHGFVRCVVPWLSVADQLNFGMLISIAEGTEPRYTNRRGTGGGKSMFPLFAGLVMASEV